MSEIKGDGHGKGQFIRLAYTDDDEYWPSCTVSSNIHIDPISYGYELHDDTNEWSIVIQFVSRQDGRTSWLVTLTQVDDKVGYIQGLGGYKDALTDIYRAIHRLTAERGWIDPLNQEV